MNLLAPSYGASRRGNVHKGRIFLSIGIVCLAAAGFIFWQTTRGEDRGETFGVIQEIIALIKKESVYDTSEEQLIEGALRGIAGAIRDPYSTYYSEQEARVHKQSLASERVGVGIELSHLNGKFIVVSPVKESPAERAGIRPLDELVQVDDTRIAGKTMSEVMALIEGEVGETVTFVLYRPVDDRHMKITVERAAMKNTTVKAEVITIAERPIGYVAISLFGESTGTEWLKALQMLAAANVEGLVVDVRDNPGGYLQSVAHLMSTIEPAGKVFAYMQNNKGELEALKTVSSETIAAAQSFVQPLPIAVLQNEGSASASEVFAGALQDWKRATIIGVTSFGKGTVQQTWALQNGGEVKLSTNKWLTPAKSWIHGVGIAPDIEVEQHPLFGIEVRPIAGRFEAGSYSEHVAYAQLVLNELGYDAVRQDGYFDAETAKVVAIFRRHYDLASGNHMDELFFAKLTEELQRFKADEVNDMPLQMGLGYIMHQIEGS